MIFGSIAVCFALGAAAEAPLISGVMVRQRWPWSRLVDIDYVLTCDPGAKVDVAVEAYDGATPLVLPLSSFSGDLFGVDRGLRRIVWDPTVTACTNSGAVPQFRVALTPVQVALYMIVDLTKTTNDADRIEYVYEDALTNGLWGAWVRNPVTNSGNLVASVVWTGVATNDLYKTDKLVLRRIPAGSYTMGGDGSTTYAMSLTKPYYAGVFEVTQRQWELVMGDRPSYFTVDYATRPFEQRSYNDIRGATNGTPVISWPATGHDVAPASFLGELRDKTGLADFDLPTEAQWEYLCRAGTTTYYNDGLGTPSNLQSNAQINALGRYERNGGRVWNAGLGKYESPPGTCGTTNGTAVVGSYAPNAWGLYDTHGNVWEWCLDWSGTPVSGPDTGGPVSGQKRMARGGSWYYDGTHCRSSYRIDSSPSDQSSGVGMRLVRTVP